MSDEAVVSRATVVAFVVALTLLAVFLYLVGIEDILATIATTDPYVLLVITVVVVAWIGAWSGSLFLTSRVFGIDLHRVEAFLVYANLMFLDNVVPFSSISADPFAALAVSRTTGAEYTKSLGTVITVDFLNFLPAPAFGTIGLMYLVLTGSFDETITELTISLIALLLGLTATGYLGWRYRDHLASCAKTALVTGIQTAKSILPRVSGPQPEELERRIDTLVADLEAMAADRKLLFGVLVLATTGWALLATTLWLSLYSVGAVIPIGLAFVLVSLMTVVELVPLPGGVGSAEPLLVTLLVAFSGTPPAVASAGVLIHRGTTYWFPVVLGGGVIPLLLRQRP